ncbi:hypothetical protein OH77DRAFT_1524597 [Trametes cingulata]|nr:hypothetical protein OH77DRAFT_1524597 [Trametes cingulata]
MPDSHHVNAAGSSPARWLTSLKVQPSASTEARYVLHEHATPSPDIASRRAQRDLAEGVQQDMAGAHSTDSARSATGAGADVETTGERVLRRRETGRIGTVRDLL